MEKQQITRIPLKYLPILQTLPDESVGKIFKIILGGDGEVEGIEKIYLDLMMVDIDNIQKNVDIGSGQGHHGIKGGRPKKKTPGDILENPTGVTKQNPNTSKEEISKEEEIVPPNPQWEEEEIDDVKKLKCTDHIENYFEKWNQVGKFKKCQQITPDIKKARRDICKQYTKDQIIQGTSNYINDIANRDQKTSYASHRFSLYEFLKQGNGLKLFINK